MDETFEGERPLFKSNNIKMLRTKILIGESAIKESKNVEAEECEFNGKYPFWHNTTVTIRNSLFTESSRAAIWYSKNIRLLQSTVEAPKIFRECSDIVIKDVNFKTDECLWNCHSVNIENAEFTGDYLLMNGTDLTINDMKLDGNYSFQSVKNCQIYNANLKSKDALWNSENVVVYNSILDGEYLAWYSKNLKLINCTIIGTQPLCYVENLTMENCTMIDTDLCFEYSTVNVEITNTIKSIKNPISGLIKAEGIEEIILDDGELDTSKCQIVTGIYSGN